jgi:hypothetical protein
VLDMVYFMVRGNCVGYGQLYGTEGIVLDMVCCMVLGELCWICSILWYWGIVLDMIYSMVLGDCVGYGQLYGTEGIVLDMVC